MAGNKKKKTQVRPLIPRPGARYACFGDGLCCTDIHGIGPLTKKEVAAMRRIDRKSAGWNDDHDDYMLNTAVDGGCVFLMADQRCSVHAQLGPEAGWLPPVSAGTGRNSGRWPDHHRSPVSLPHDGRPPRDPARGR